MAAEDVGKVFGTERIRIEGLGARNKGLGARFKDQGKNTKDKGSRCKVKDCRGRCPHRTAVQQTPDDVRRFGERALL